MQKFEKMIALLGVVTGLSLTAFSFGAFADESGRYIKTEAIPDNVKEYAKNVFSTLKASDLSIIGVTASPENLKLSNGFAVNLITTENYDKYYFPLLNGDSIVANLIVNVTDNELTYTLLQDDVSNALNSLKTDGENPYTITVSDTAVYAVNKDGSNLLGESPWSTDTQKQNDASILQTNAISDSDTSTILIDGNNVYDVDMNTSTTYAITGRSCDNFPIVANKSVDGQGVCWACSTASIIEYIKDGSSSSSADATAIRDELLTKQVTGNIDSAQKYIKQYTGRSLSKQLSPLTWDTIKDQILSKNNPCYMRLYAYPNIYHATVLMGYDYESSNDSNHRMYLMDPNMSNYVITSHSSIYSTSYGYTFTWEHSLYL